MTKLRVECVVSMIWNKTLYRFIHTALIMQQFGNIFSSCSEGQEKSAIGLEIICSLFFNMAPTCTVILISDHMIMFYMKGVAHCGERTSNPAVSFDSTEQLSPGSSCSCFFFFWDKLTVHYMCSLMYKRLACENYEAFNSKWLDEFKRATVRKHVHHNNSIWC